MSRAILVMVGSMAATMLASCMVVPRAIAQPPATATATGRALAPIAVPEGSPAQLLEFVSQVRRRPPPANDYDSVTAHLAAVEQAVVAAVDKLGDSATPDERSRGMIEKLAALAALRRLNVDGAETALRSYLDEVRRAPSSTIPSVVAAFALLDRLERIDSTDAAELTNWLTDVRRHIAQAPPEAASLNLAQRATTASERAGLLEPTAEAAREFAARLAASAEPDVAAAAARFEGLARLMSLPGQPLELHGKPIDGATFDWSSYRGKTVLVVFFASWSGPFIADLPTIRECAARYEEQGFRVVGLSLDDDRRRLEDFLARDPLPGPVLADDEGRLRGDDLPQAIQLGINKLPRAILVGADGRVVSLDARGENLWDLLGRQLGPPKKKESADAASSPAIEKAEKAETPD